MLGLYCASSMGSKILVRRIRAMIHATMSMSLPFFLCGDAGGFSLFMVLGALCEPGLLGFLR